MFEIHGEIVTYEFNTEGYMKSMRTYLEAQARLAAAEFAKTALRNIPVRTGFVAGSFGTLSDLLGAGARFNPIVKVVRGFLSAARNFLGKKKKESAANGQKEYYYGGGGKTLKTTVSGRQFSTPTADILKWKGDILIFNYEVDISYFSINDNVAGHSPTAPWGAFVAGQTAFEDYMEKVGLLALPKVEDFLVPKSQSF